MTGNVLPSIRSSTLISIILSENNHYISFWHAFGKYIDMKEYCGNDSILHFQYFISDGVSSLGRISKTNEINWSLNNSKKEPSAHLYWYIMSLGKESDWTVFTWKYSGPSDAKI